MTIGYRIGKGSRFDETKQIAGDVINFACY
jgi:hypothetical protein